MAGLFGSSADNIGLHIRNVYTEGELDEAATVEDSSVVRSEGGREVRRRVRRYNLDVIICVGYRVKSGRATQFRRWATGVLRDHLLRGYTINEKRLLARGVEFDQAVALLSPSPSGGDLRHIEPWRIDEGDLEPVQFRWSPREAGPIT